MQTRRPTPLALGVLIVLPILVTTALLHRARPDLELVPIPVGDEVAATSPDLSLEVSTSPGARVDVTEPARTVVEGPRLFTGTVVDGDEPLAPGWITVLGDAGEEMIETELRRGRFAFELSPTTFRRSHVTVTVGDGNASIFSGVVVVAEDVIIPVRSSDSRSIRGEIIVVNATPAQEWFAFLTARQGPGKVAIGTSTAHADVEATVTWAEMDPRLGRVQGPVDLTIQPFSPKESALGHQRFESLSAFKAALELSIVVEAPVRTISVGDRAGEIESFRLLSDENRTARYLGTTGAGATAEIGLPDGSYLAHGSTHAGDDWVGELNLDGQSEATIRWIGRVPGATDLEVTLLDHEGTPIPHHHVAFELESARDGVHSGSSLRATDEFGVTRLVGLLTERYRIFAFSGGPRSRVELGTVDMATTSTFTGHLRPRCSVRIELDRESGAPDVVDHGSCSVFASLDGSEWIRAPAWQSFTNGGLSIDDLDGGSRYRFAVLGDGWGGVSEPTLASREVVSVPVRSLHAIRVVPSGTEAAEAPGAAGRMVRVARDPAAPGVVLPWHTSTWVADEPATLYAGAPATELRVELVDAESGAVLGVHEAAPDGTFAVELR